MAQSVKWVFWMGLLAFTTGSLHAQSAGVIARMGFGARGLAVGNALAGDASGQASAYYNPALAPYTTRQSLSLSASLLSYDRSLQFVELSTPLQPRAGISGGLIHAGVSNIDLRDLSGYHTGYATTNEFAFFLAFGLKVHSRVSLGTSIQLFRSILYEGVPAARSIGFDIGILVRAMPNLHVGLVVEDLLAEYNWDTSALGGSAGGSRSDPFPIRLRLGASWRTQDEQLRLLAEYESHVARREVLHPRVIRSGYSVQVVNDPESLTLHSSRLHLGAEYKPVPIFVLRGGLAHSARVPDGRPQPSAGLMVEQALGLLLTRVAYTVVLEPWTSGAMHFISLRFFL